MRFTNKRKISAICNFWPQLQIFRQAVSWPPDTAFPSPCFSLDTRSAIKVTHWLTDSLNSYKTHRVVVDYCCHRFRERSLEMTSFCWSVSPHLRHAESIRRHVHPNSVPTTQTEGKSCRLVALCALLRLQSEKNQKSKWKKSTVYRKKSWFIMIMNVNFSLLYP